MAVIAILTSVTVLYLFLRSRFRNASWESDQPESQRERFVYASEVLQTIGFKILDERIAHEAITYFGHRKFSSYLLADFIVEKDGQPCPVRVKRLRDPERVSGAWLRSHVMPLYVIYDAPVGLLQPETHELTWVDFSLEVSSRLRYRKWRMRLLWLCIGAVLGFALAQSH
ncbi:hypothetical protein [Ferroacidibacillus organovorans]|uniref:Uncharacterized protein n=1 Tax=Ferroacidibacillus organovorans TaxID=1765683 RepID=A0A853KB98_9BACL|nr:hypothetical protein [Ferroacidibacillus organovorans]KYP81023.1 hypothetical protein AYJ22_09235 [Ferroacidibacillus organovorans]OAG94286.1 hypothetical protein AYW79_06010 [Ferroacidibacillus organovorans]